MITVDFDNQQSIVVDLYRNDFVSRWVKLFEHTVKTVAINQEETFAENLTELEARQRLESAVKNINAYLKREVIAWPKQPDWDNHSWFNELHIWFEKLSGPWGQPSRLFLYAPDSFRSSVRDLNFYVHRLERRPYEIKRYCYVSFDKNSYTRESFKESDYKFFTQVFTGGEAWIHYAELGKTYIDLYKDDLPVDYPGLKNLHYYSAEINLNLSTEPFNFYPEGFEQWAIKNNIDLKDTRLGIGSIPVGKVRDIEKAYEVYRTSSKIINIRIDHGQAI